MAELDCERTDELAAAYALDALEPSEAAAVGRHLATCDRAHVEARSVVGMGALVAASSAPVEPRLELRDRVMTTVATTPQDHRATATAPVAPAPSAPARSRDWWGWLRPSLAQRLAVVAVPLAAILAVVAIGLGAQVADRDRALSEVAAVLAGGGQALRVDGTAGRGYLLRQGDQATLVAADVAAPSGSALYEMWLIPADGAPVPAGTFRPEGDDLVVARLSGSLARATVFAVTLEQQPVDAPTSNPVLTVDLTQ